LIASRTSVGIDMNRGWLTRPFIAVFVVTLGSAGAAQNGFDLSNATIPRDEILPGGPPRDGIPAINDPQFIKPSEVNFLRDDDRVLSVKIDDEVRAYPLRILNWHEIVNDQVGDHAIVVTYCPLAGAGMVFDRSVNGRKLSFGVSGLLYQSDLVMYDRETESLWSQVAMKAVSGAQVGAELRWLPSGNSTWHAWREAHPDGKVLSRQTGHDRDYSEHAYATYERSDETMFPVRWSRPELSKKSWVIGVIVNGQAKAYALDDLKKETPVQDNVAGAQIEIAYDPARQSAEITDKQNGQAVAYTMAYWFAWQAFYPKTELFRH
jgi:Protein of unknown function (DUF3179)